MRTVLWGLGWPPHQAGGGLDRYLAGLHGALRDRGEDAVAVVTGGPSGPPLPGLLVSGPPDDPFALRVARFARSAVRAARRAEVIDAHFAPYAWLPLKDPRLRRTPLVVHFQGPWAAESRVQGGDSRLGLVAKHRIERSVYRRARRIVVLSAAFKRILVERYGVDPWRIRVVPPAVDLSAFSPGDRGTARRAIGLPDTSPVVLAVRRLVPRMGLDVLVDATARLREQGSDVNLVVVGDGPLRHELEQQAARAGIQAAVLFLGAASDRLLQSAYRAADVMVVPSLDYEGFGLVVLEALASGTPVVASEVGGLPAALRGLGGDLLVPPGDVGALTTRLADGLEGRRPLPGPERCRAHAEGFSWGRVAAANQQVYEQAVEPTSGGRRPRVVIVDHCAQLSGAEIGLSRLLPALRGWDVHVIVAEDGPLVGRLEAEGISVEVLPLDEASRGLGRSSVEPGRLPLRSALLTAAYVVRLSRRLRQLDPDLVHAYSLKAGIVCAPATRMARRPLVWQVHDRIADDYLPPPAVRLVRWVARHLATDIVVSSHAVLDTLRLPDGAGTVVPYALSPEWTERPPIVRKAAVDELTVGMVGRLMPWKGQHVFIGAFAEAFPSGGARARIIGSALFGQDAYEQELRDLAVRLGVGDRVEFAGFSDDVFGAMGDLDILVHASVLPEPFGQVITEGMAAGVPVIASGSGGAAEIVDDGRTGLLVPPGDGPALAAAMRRLAGDPTLRAALVTAARREVDTYRADAVADLLEGVYDRHCRRA